MFLPNVRTTDIVVQETGGELLIYDLITSKAYCLNETAAIIYRSCSDNIDFDELKTKHAFTDDLIFLALDDLKKQKLIENDYQPRFKGQTRREVIKRIGLGSMVVLPIVMALTAPQAVNAQSCVIPGGFPPGTSVTGFPVQPTCEDCRVYGAMSCCTGNATLVGCSDLGGGDFACTVMCSV